MHLEENYDPDGLAYEVEVACGTRSSHMSKRTASEVIWRAIAEGKAHISTKTYWVNYVALRLVEGLIDNPDLDDKLRGRESLRALGLYDKGDRYAGLRSLIETMMSFEDLSGPVPKPVPTPRPQVILIAARERGMFAGVDDRRAIESVRRQLNQVIGRGPRSKP